MNEAGVRMVRGCGTTELGISCVARFEERQRAVQVPGKHRPSIFSLFFFQAEDGIRDVAVTGVQTCALPICFIDAYYQALVANNPAALPQAAKARITLNGRQSPLAATFWPAARAVRWRFDAVNERLGDTGTQVVISNDDGSETMEVVRLKVAGGAITEMEIVRCNKGDAGEQWWGPEQLDPKPSSFLTLSIPPAERDSYYGLVAVADGYFRAFQTNGTPDYHRADLQPDTRRFENGA